MDAASIPSFVVNQQNAYNTLSMLMLTSYLFPKSAKLNNGDEFDFLIIGGGTAGCVIANRLVKANFSVLLLEAGDDTPYESFLPGTLGFLPHSRIDWNHTAEPNGFTEKCHSSPRLPLITGKVLGGTSAMNFLSTTRGHYTDYHRWAIAANDSSWEFNNLIDLFIRNENLLAPAITKSHLGIYRGVGGAGPESPEAEGKIALAIDNSTTLCNYLQSYKEMGNELVKDLNGYTTGYARGLLSLANGYRQSTAYAYLTPAYFQDSKTNPKLFVSKNTLVTKIDFNENKEAIGVMAEINNKKPIFLKAKKEVILSAGTINSPHLLMLSGIGPRKHLEEKKIKVIADLPVGENLQDLASISIVHKTKPTIFPNRTNLHELTASFVLGFKSLNKCQKRPDYGTITYIVHKPEYIILFCVFTFGFQPEICDKLKNRDINREISYSFLYDLNPKSRGKVLLKSACPKDAPIIEAGYFTAKEDIENTIKYIKDFINIGNTTFFKNSGGEALYPTGSKCCQNFGTDAYWKCYALCMSSSTWSFCGTNSMGAVVDSKLKVFGVQKLRVADASIIPNPVSGGNYEATIVVAEKVSDMIKEEWVE